MLGSGCFINMSLGGAVRDEEDKNGCLLELACVFPAVYHTIIVQ